ncbi:MAG: RSP_2648 family PIN domain-containing protein [Gemmobacter sp.]
MKAVLDACVLVPPVLRECLLAVAGQGLFVPLWSDRILGEWARAVARHGQDAGPDIAAATTRFSAARIPPAPGIEARLHLPDANDIHVLATAIAGNADAIVTWNAADFPRGVLAGEGIARRDPDGLLWEMWSHHPGPVGAALEIVRAEAERRAGASVALRPLLKRAKLTRLARAV